MTETPRTVYQYPNEAFVLMHYRCQKCCHRERIWNGRDGVTPFTIRCQKCGGDARSITPRTALSQPTYRPLPGERVFVSATADDCRAEAEAAFERSKGTTYEIPEDQREAWVAMVYRDLVKREIGAPKCVVWQDPVQSQVATLTADRDSWQRRAEAAEAQVVETRAHWAAELRRVADERDRLQGQVAAVPDDLRAQGWAVAVHNDYRQDGESHTFWLFTHPDGRYAKGEGRTDAEALAQVRAIVGGAGEGDGAK